MGERDREVSGCAVDAEVEEPSATDTFLIHDTTASCSPSFASRSWFDPRLKRRTGGEDIVKACWRAHIDDIVDTVKEIGSSDLPISDPSGGAFGVSAVKGPIMSECRIVSDGSGGDI